MLGMKLRAGAIVVWLVAVVYLKFQRSLALWSSLLVLVQQYRDFHLWHGYSLKAAAAAGVAVWIIWVAIECGGQILHSIVPREELSALERCVFSAGLGFAAISLATLLLGFCGLWYVSVFRFAMIAATIVYLPRRWPRFNWNSPGWSWWMKAALGLLVVAALIFLVGDLAPEVFYDSLHYHLAVPNLYLLSHRIYNEPNFAYASFAMNVQMFWGFGLTVGNEITAKLLHGSMALLLILTFVAFEKRYLSPGAALLGGLLFVSMPMVGLNATTAGIDVASSALQFLAVFALTRAMAGDDENVIGFSCRPTAVGQWLRFAGILTGIAATCKYTSLATLPIACAIIIWKQRQREVKWRSLFKQLAIFVAYAGLAMFPFYAKNLMFHHNPVYPITAGFWGQGSENANWANVVMETSPPKLSGRSSALEILKRFVRDPWLMTMNNEGSDFMGPLVLGLLPLLLFCRRNKASQVLARYSLGLWVAWLLTTTTQVRFGMPLLAILSLLLADAVVRFRLPPMIRQSVFAICLLAAAWTLYYTAVLIGMQGGWQVVGGMISEHDYLTEAHPTYPMPDYEALDWINENLPAGSKVMIAGDSRSYYSRIPVVPASVFDPQPIVLAAGAATDGPDLARLLREQGVTHLFLNFGEAVRTEPRRPFTWDARSWDVFDDFWHRYVRCVWASQHAPNPSPKDLFVYEIRSDLESRQSASVAPLNPFERWKPARLVH
jgi:hypothetical protein